MNFVESLIQLFDKFCGFFQFFSVVDAYEQGVVLRLGRFSRVLHPGLHWILPFWIERVLTTPVVNQTIRPPHQSVTTEDGVNIVVGGIVRYQIKDVQVFLLTVWETRDVFEDVVAGAIKRIVQETTWSKLCKNDIDQVLTDAIRAETERFGVTIVRATLVDMGKIRSIRLMLDAKHAPDPHITPGH